ncbi:MAG TPA: FkbM family methyltransferase [Acidimicrobiales bacterium]|nr:FkbM family methyltransferase [Acidimicrobiales bacterium]
MWLTATTVRNLPLVVLDRAGLVTRARYRLYNGLTFECRSKTSDLAEVVVVCSGYEYPSALVERLPPDAVVMDVGANIGAFCGFVHVHTRGKAYRGFAFEPFQKNVAVLRVNLAVNGINQFEVVETAISSVDGTVHLQADGPPDAVAVSAVPTGVQSESVRLSTFCQAHKISWIHLLKMDVEGQEYEILEDDLPFLTSHVSTLVVEFHPVQGRDGQQWVRDRLSGAFDVEVWRSGGGSGILIGRRKSRTPTIHPATTEC